MAKKLFELTIKEEIILHCLYNEKYGLEIVEIIKKSMGIELKPNSIYPTLHNLKCKGFIEFCQLINNKTKYKYYKITNLGKEKILEKQKILSYLSNL